MHNLLISILGFIIAIGILITVHEFGHFWVARRFGIKVLRFSIGFGRPFFRWYDKYGTEYVLSSIPLGGYVALFGERGGQIPVSERPMAFSFKPVWVRIAVLAAGPVFNLGFAIIAYWLMFMIGLNSMVPILGQVPAKSAADLAGLHQNQEIVSIEHKPVYSWEGVSVALLSRIGDTKTLNVEVRDFPKGKIETHNLDISELESTNHDRDILKDLGLTQKDPYPPVVGSLLPGYPAEEAGVKVNDKILEIDGHPMHTRTDASQYIQTKPDQIITLTVLRKKEAKDTNIKSSSNETNDKPSTSNNSVLNTTNTHVANLSNETNDIIQIKVKPIEKQLEEAKTDGKIDGKTDGKTIEKTIGFIGVYYSTPKLPSEYIRNQHYGPVESLLQACNRTWKYTILTFEMLGKMILGKISVKHLSGPITIAQYAGQTVSIGIEYFLSFLAVVSISLGVINLLPIPLLDGGHILYCIWELVTGKPVSEHAQMVGIWLGGLFIVMITLIAIYNDIARIEF